MGTVPLDDMRAVADDVTGEVIDACGHFIAEERPDVLADRLRAFYARVSRD